MPTLAKFLPDIKPAPHYDEVAQPNPLRWQLYKQEGETLVPQTNQFRCKDFLNDVVGWFYGRRGRQYGFNSEKMEFNPYGVFVRLYNVTPAFQKNVDAVLNPLLNEKLKFVEVGENQVLTLLPRELFNSTFTISKVSHLLRLCNVGQEVDSPDKLKEYHTSPENKDRELYVTWDRLNTLTLPEKYQIYWYYAGDGYNSNTEAFTMLIMHNNGYRSWNIATNGEVK